MNILFTVYAKPQPQGSTRAFMRKGMRFPVVTTANKGLKPYRQAIAELALLEMKAMQQTMIPRKTPVWMGVRFFFQRPVSKSKKAAMTVKPDLDKLCRAVGDALTGICFEDDSQVMILAAEKNYDAPERTEIHVHDDPYPQYSPEVQ